MTRSPKDDLHRLLINLIDAFSNARDSSALQKAIMVYLEASEVRKMDVEVLEGGVHVILEIKDDSGGARTYTFACREFGEASGRPRDGTWSEKMNVIVPACQKWAREHLKKPSLVVKRRQGDLSLWSKSHESGFFGVWHTTLNAPTTWG